MLSLKMTTAARRATRRVLAPRGAALPLRVRPRRHVVVVAADSQKGATAREEKASMPWLAIAQLGGTLLLSVVAYFATDTLMDLRGDSKELRGDSKELRGDIQRLDAKLDTKIDATNAKIDAKFDALIQQQVLDRVTRLENDRFLPSKGTENSK